MTDTSCTDDNGVNVPSFQKVTFFQHTETLSICILTVCLKMLLNSVILDEQVPNVLLHSDSSFRLRNNIKSNTPAVKSWKLSFMGAIYI